MNTRIVFTCINIASRDIIKYAFETIIDEVLEDTWGADEWVENNVSKHYDQFDLSLVLDWAVVLCEPTDADVKETELIKSDVGHIFFEDSLEYTYYRLGKAQIETKILKDRTKKIKKETAKLRKQPEKKPTRKEYQSVWIEPSGEVHEVRFAGHNDFAYHWFEQNEPDEVKDILKSNKYFYEALQDKGWIRKLGWVDPPSFVIPNRITPKQKTALRDYCMGNDVKYEFFPEILKG